MQRKVFGAPLRKDILHRVVVWQRDAERQGTQSTKSRGEVSGTTRKAAPQKGRGAARVGSLRTPQRRGGTLYCYFFLFVRIKDTLHQILGIFIVCV